MTFASEMEMYSLIKHHLKTRENEPCENVLVDEVTFRYMGRDWRADVLGIWRNNESECFVGVEAKMDLDTSPQALRQALALQSFCSEVYIAFPKITYQQFKERESIKLSIASMNLGLMLVGKQEVLLLRTPTPIRFNPNIFNQVRTSIKISDSPEIDHTPEWRRIMMIMLDDKEAWINDEFTYRNPQKNYNQFRDGYLSGLGISLLADKIVLFWHRQTRTYLENALKNVDVIVEAIVELFERMGKYRSKILNKTFHSYNPDELDDIEDILFPVEPVLTILGGRHDRPFLMDAPSELSIDFGYLANEPTLSTFFKTALIDKESHISGIEIHCYIMDAIVDTDRLTINTNPTVLDSHLLHSVLFDLTKVMKAILGFQ